MFIQRSALPQQYVKTPYEPSDSAEFLLVEYLFLSKFLNIFLFLQNCLNDMHSKFAKENQKEKNVHIIREIAIYQKKFGDNRIFIPRFFFGTVA